MLSVEQRQLFFYKSQLVYHSTETENAYLVFGGGAATE